MERELLIVGIGGTTVPGSSTERALRLALDVAQRAGANTAMFDGARLSRLPHYSSDSAAHSDARALVDAIRQADGLILASPGYHGSISGLVKNAVDHLEATAKDQRPYLDGLPVGLIATAYGWQACASTLAALRSVVHALRGWPTPYGAALNTHGGLALAADSGDPAVAQIQTVGRQVIDFAGLVARGRLAEPG